MKNKESEQMGYYRVRKNWNNGKWDSSQICAYTDKQKQSKNAQKKGCNRDIRCLIQMVK